RFVEVLQALDRPMGARPVLGLVEVLRDLAAQDVRDEGRLSRTADPGYGDERAERDLDVDVLEVVGAGAANDEPLAIALTAVCRDRDLSVAPQERRGYRVRVFQHLLDGAGG